MTFPDIKMPKMHGYGLYDRMKRRDDKVEVCFVFVSLFPFLEPEFDDKSKG
jgi:YesN/AraC family two-component response regulator